MKLRRIAYLMGLAAVMAVVVSCRKDDKSINFFTLNQDIQFGASMDSMIMDDPVQFPLLSKSLYPTAYQHIERIRDKLLASGQVAFDDRFPWEVKIIDNDSTDNMTKQYGIGIMLGMLLGNNPGQLAEIAAGLASGLTALAFSRENEYEADQYAVKYMSATDYDPRGLAGFFEKMEGHPVPPTFLSTHPSPENRIEQIFANWELEGSKEGQRFTSRYQDFKSSLPAPLN